MFKMAENRIGTTRISKYDAKLLDCKTRYGLLKTFSGTD